MSPPVNPVPSDPQLPETADVVVIGGGIVGTSAAYFLAGRGLSVALLEKGVVAGEQSSRNWGWCRVQNRDEREIPLMLRSMALWDHLSGEEGLDVGFRRSGLIYVTKDPAELAKWAAWVDMARAYQSHHRVVGAEEARSLTPGNPGAWIGGIVSPRDGRAEPSIAAPAIAAAARRRGATLHQGVAVRGLDLTGGRVSGVHTERGRVRASAVLLAGGAWSSMFLRRHGVDLPQSAIHSTVFATTPAPQVSPGGLVTPDFTLTPLPDGGYIVAAKARGRIEVTPQGLRYARKFWPTLMERRKSVQIRLGRSFLEGPEAFHGRWSFDAPTPFERQRVLDPKPQAQLAEAALREVVSVYPHLAGIRVARVWAGWIDSTPDAVPVISPIEAVPGLHLATGFSGHGFGIGPGAGHLAADLVAGAAPIVDPAPFAHARLVDGSPIRRPGMM